MAEAHFPVKGRGGFRVRLEPTEIVGTGSSTLPALTLQLKLQLPSIQLQSVVNYTLLRLAGRLSIASENTDLASFETPPIAETSGPNSYERSLSVEVPLDIRQIKHIEELRDGKDLVLRITLTGLVAFDVNNEFERLQEQTLHLHVPRSHWIDRALNVWKISDLRLLEINPPTNGNKEIVRHSRSLPKPSSFTEQGTILKCLQNCAMRSSLCWRVVRGKKLIRTRLKTC